MYTLRSSKKLRIAALILLIITLTLTLLSGLAALILEADDVYFDGGALFRRDTARMIWHWQLHHYSNYAYLVQSDEADPWEKSHYESLFTRENSNLSVKAELEIVGIKDPSLIYETYPTEENYQYEFTHSWGYATNRIITLTARLQPDLTAKDAFHYLMPLVDFLIAARFVIIWIAVIGLLLSLFLIGFLMASAGHQRGESAIRRSWFDKIPLDLLLGLYVLIFALTIAFADFVMHDDLGAVLYIAAALILWITLAIALLVSLAVRIKSGTFWQNTLIRRLLAWIGRFFVLIGRVLARFPLYAFALIGFLLCVGVDLFFLAGGDDIYPLYWLFTRPIWAALLVYLVLMLRRLERGGRELAAGNTAYRVDTRYMTPNLARHGANLNSLSAGLAHAVEERMKSERMKSELITNVSHDIKTPLTSIINYVGLLKKEGADSPSAPEYLEVLDHQSARLKKLSEDLIEASKASAGCVSVDRAPTDLNLLIQQAAGEYEERLTAAGIGLILRLDETSPIVEADGRLLWRIFDNLLSNIAKYGQPSTRAYIVSSVGDRYASVTFKNISGTELNISADELMERFVRGDASRHTEGSGLGLSIARSLAELQDGRFELAIDGDLFKASVVLPLASEPMPADDTVPVSYPDN